jgi:hypothetical protein
MTHVPDLLSLTGHLPNLICGLGLTNNVLNTLFIPQRLGWAKPWRPVPLKSPGYYLNLG